MGFSLGVLAPHQASVGMRASLLFSTWLPLTLWNWGSLVTAEWQWKPWPSSEPSVTPLQWGRKEHFITSEWCSGPAWLLTQSQWTPLEGPPIALWGWQPWLSTFFFWHHSGKSAGVPGKGKSLGFYSVFASGGGHRATVFSMVFGVKP